VENSRTLYLDFEFNHIKDEKVNVVCCSTYDPATKSSMNFWVHDDEKQRKALTEYLRSFHIFIAYNAVAEARSFYSLGIDPTKVKWIDLFLEYRCLSNHNDKLNYGKQLVDGIVKTVHKPRKPWELAEGEENGPGFKQTHSLAEATYKLLGEIRDQKHKDEMRDLIISEPVSFTAKEKKDIVDYCALDVVMLPDIYEAILKEYDRLDCSIVKENLKEEMIIRGEYAAYTAIMECKGYPLDVEKTKNFSRQVGNILYDCQREINQTFPEIKPFVWDKKNSRFRWDQNKTREWIKSTPYYDRWEKTDKGAISLSLESFQKFYNYAHDYPSDILGAQFVRYLKLKQSLYGFVPTTEKKKKTFWDYVGNDGRVRPYFNIYGSQSSRSQPAATGFMMLKPAWMRALVQAKPGYALASIDYGSQEFLIAALMAEDDNMIESYLSGDVYLAFAKLTGAVPENATKDTHKRERNLAKSTVLGLSYMMSKYGLALKLSQDTGRTWTEEEAQEQIDVFYEAYPKLKKFQAETLKHYVEEGQIKLPCGWYVWGDNENTRSVNNVPVQGMGACIMRKAVQLAMDQGIYVCMTLHDALYIEYPVGQEIQIKQLAECMRQAFAMYFEDYQKDTALKIKLDPYAWSPNYEADSELDIDGWKVPCSNIYLDERAISDFNKFSQYFEIAPELDL
jgi:DNA polymerase-1